MSDSLLRQVQLLQLELLKEFRRACEVLGVRYILDFGTLLGAVRHKGFIPWDDDVDVGLLRDEYEVFLCKAPQVLKDGFYLRTFETDPSWSYPFAKLCVSSSECLNVVTDVPFNCSELSVDLFPYDVYPAGKRKRRLQGARYERYKRLLRYKVKYSRYVPPRNFLRRPFYDVHFFIRRCETAFLSREELIERVQRARTLYNDESSGFLFEGGGDRGVKYGNRVVPENCLRETTEILFEGECFSCPIDYDAFLKATYGDYMKLPPEKERFPKHSVDKRAFGIDDDFKH